MPPEPFDDYDPMGDSRRCPVHPDVVTSSPDGLHDAPCGRCEYESECEMDRRLHEMECGGPFPAESPYLGVDRNVNRWKIEVDDDIPF